MKLFLVSRTDDIGWCEDMEMVIVAEDEKHAERKARWKSEDFKKAKLTVQEIPLDAERVIMTTNKGG